MCVFLWVSSDCFHSQLSLQHLWEDVSLLFRWLNVCLFRIDYPVPLFRRNVKCITAYHLCIVMLTWWLVSPIISSSLWHLAVTAVGLSKIRLQLKKRLQLKLMTLQSWPSMMMMMMMMMMMTISHVCHTWCMSHLPEEACLSPNGHFIHQL